MKKVKMGSLLLIIGMAVLLAGAVMSMMDLKQWSDYVLVAGAVLVIFSGAFRMRDK